MSDNIQASRKHAYMYIHRLFVFMLVSMCLSFFIMHSERKKEIVTSYTRIVNSIVGIYLLVILMYVCI